MFRRQIEFSPSPRGPRSGVRNTLPTPLSPTARTDSRQPSSAHTQPRSHASHHHSASQLQRNPALTEAEASQAHAPSPQKRFRQNGTCPQPPLPPLPRERAPGTALTDLRPADPARAAPERAGRWFEGAPRPAAAGLPRTSPGWLSGSTGPVRLSAAAAAGVHGDRPCAAAAERPSPGQGPRARWRVLWTRVVFGVVCML